jgi:hypothetical protein
MKKKRNTYILLVVVLLVWSMVIYRFFSYTGPEIPESAAPSTMSLKPIAIKKRETFSIDVNYRDPFLGKMYLPVTSGKAKKKKHIVPEPIQWPQVIYKGIVSDNKNKKKVFMLIINGRAYMMKEKETQDEITLKRGNRQSITVKFKGDLTDILIQE